MFDGAFIVTMENDVGVALSSPRAQSLTHVWRFGFHKPSWGYVVPRIVWCSCYLHCARVLFEKIKKKNNKGFVRTCVATPAPTMYILCVWCVGPICSQHWSTSLPGHSMQHDPLQQPVCNWSCSTAVDSLGTPTVHGCVCMCLLYLPLAGLLAACPTLLTSPLHSECVQRP